MSGLHVGLVAFPQVTQLDLTGPLQVFCRIPGATVHVVARTTDPVSTDCGVGLVPTATFAGCPPLDVVCVPGGFGVIDAFRDPATLGFVQAQGGSARYVTSVCTGAFVLGVAGLLRGRRATTHWAYRSLLPRVGAVPVAERVVRDGNRITGGGVTAGIDFALALAAELAGDEVARRIQLTLEYDPAPPFSDGAPERAAPAVRSAVEAGFGDRVERFGAAVSAAVGP